MSTKPQKLPVFNTDKELADFLLSNVSESMKQAIKAIVKIMVKQEMDQLRKEVDEKLSFNGYYHRQMFCGLGKIEDIPIARFREKAASDLSLDSLSVFDHEKEKFLKLVGEMHRHGVSDRKVGKICQTVYGMKFSKNRVSFVHKKLAEEESMNINGRPVTDEFEYLLFDGIWVKAKSCKYCHELFDGSSFHLLGIFPRLLDAPSHKEATGLEAQNESPVAMVLYGKAL